MTPGSNAASVELIGERLVLRSIQERDEELYYELFCDPVTMRYIGPPWTRADAARAFRGVLDASRGVPPRALFLVLRPKEEQRPTGLCSLQNFDYERRTAELGLMIVPEGRAYGVATEALITFIAHAFAMLAFDDIWVRFADDHAAARSAARSAGLVRQAVVSPQDRTTNLRRWSAYRGSWRPAAHMGHQT